jgi:hypothetical protein
MQLARRYPGQDEAPGFGPGLSLQGDSMKTGLSWKSFARPEHRRSRSPHRVRIVARQLSLVLAAGGREIRRPAPREERC